MPDTLTPLSKVPIDPRQGYGFRSQPRPEYLQALDTVIAGLDDPRTQTMLGMMPLMPWLYHGTKAERVANIVKEGFDPKRIGEMWGAAFGKLKGRSGPGVYLSDHPDKAHGWGEVVSEGVQPGLVRVFIPQKSILDTSIHSAQHIPKTPEGRAELLNIAKQQGYKAVKFPEETVIPDPTQIPLRNIRSFPGPNQMEQDAATLYGALEYKPSIFSPRPRSK